MAQPQRCHVPLKLIGLHDDIAAQIAAQIAAKPDSTIDELRSWLLVTHATMASKGLIGQDTGRPASDAKKSIHAAEEGRPDARGKRLVEALPHGHSHISTFIGGLRPNGMVVLCVN